MDTFQRQTTAFFTRLCLENAMDRNDLETALMYSGLLDELTLTSLRDDQGEKTA